MYKPAIDYHYESMNKPTQKDRIMN